LIDTRAISVTPAPLDEVLAMRDDYRREMACQIVHDSWHRRGFTNAFLCRVGGEIAGYGCVGGVPNDAKDIVKEFYLRRSARHMARPLFRALVEVSGARTIDVQTNDTFLTSMFFDFAVEWRSDPILFADAAATTIEPPAGVVLRAVGAADRTTMFTHTGEPVGDWGLECDGAIAATGGIFFHYNPPYGDIYMEVSEPYRRRGLGSYLVQELKRICRHTGSIPGARCGIDNTASRGALERAGMLPCARILRGTLREN
jgi:GNAT superfamily N-acetyltransferase